MRNDLEQAGGALALVDGRAVGCLRFDRQPGRLQVRRVAVDPSVQGRGIGTALMAWAHEYAYRRGYSELRVGVRRQLPQNQRFYERLGYEVIAEHRHPGYAEVTWVEMRRPV